MAYNNPGGRQESGSKQVEWTKRSRSDGDRGDERRRGIVHQSSHEHFKSQDCNLYLGKLNGRRPNTHENAAQNERAHQQDGNYQRDNHTHQNYYERDNDDWNNERKQNFYGHLNDRTYRNESFRNCCDHHQVTHNTNHYNHNAQNSRERNQQDVAFSHLRSRHAYHPYQRPTDDIIQRRNHDLQSQRSSAATNPRFLEGRYPVFDNSHHEPGPLKHSILQRNNRSICSSSESDNRSKRSRKERDDKIRHLNDERKDRSTRRTSSTNSKWNISAPDMSSKLEMSDFDSDTEHELLMANRLTSSDIRQTNINRSMSISKVSSSTKARQSNVDKSIGAQTNDLLPTSITTQSALIIPDPSNVLRPSANVESTETSSLSSTTTELFALSKTSDDIEYSSKSTVDKYPSNSKPIISQDYNNLSTNSPAATPKSNVPVKRNHKVNRKRSIDISVATKSSDENSSAAANDAQRLDADEVSAKKSMYSTCIPAVTTKKSNRSEKLATTIKHKKEKNNNMVDKPAVPTTSGLNQNRQNDLIHATTNVPTNIPKKRVSCIKIKNVNEQKESKADLHRKEIDKKLKQSLTDKKETRVGKPNNFKKNYIEQFKFILTMMKTKSNGWTLVDTNVNNFCDAIHHFEKQSDKMCALTEVKIFEESKVNKISYKNLFSDEFNIQRYFGTFYKFEHSCFGNQHSKFVIVTNREVDMTLLNNNGIRVSCNNDQYRFHVIPPYEESKIYKKCLECFVLPKLAELLYEFVHSNHKLPHFNMELIRKYHLALVNESVLQMYDEKQKGERVRFAKFHPNFIHGIKLSNAAKELRNHFKKHPRGLPTCSMKFRVGNKDFGEDVASTRFLETVNTLPDENCNKSFEHFFKVFEIVKLTKLSDEVIKRELGEKSLKLEDETYFNAVQKELAMSLNEHGLKPDVLKSLKHIISKLEVIEKISQRPYRHVDIQFEQETFLILSTAIATKDIILCSTESLLLSELKMRQFSKYRKYSENQESLFVTYEILFQMTDDVVSAFSHCSTNLLVIIWENNVVADSGGTKQIEDVIERVRNVTSESQGKKKSVIIADKENVNLWLPRYRIFRIDEDFTFKSENGWFKSIEIILQGRTLRLSDLADNAAINNLIESPRILEKLLTEKVKIGSSLAKPADFKEKLYEFKLKQRVIIDSKIFQENINDIFLISNIDCEHFSFEYKPLDRVVYLSDSQLKPTDLPLNIKYILLDSNVDPVFIRNQMKGKNVHLLSYEFNKFIWESTSGSSAALLKYKITDNNENCASLTVEDILINGLKTVIVSGESGIGKSACLYDFANQASEAYEPVWIIQVDLNRPLKNSLKGYSIESSENAIYFLADYLDLKNEQKELLIMSAQGQLKVKLMLFVDGYDDVYENVDLMTSLLQHLQNSNIERMFLATRTNKLEKLLGTFSYSLQFGNEEKFQFADKFSNDKDFKNNLGSKTKLLNTPLHLKMFMKLYQRKPEKVSIDSHYDLYKSYVNLHLSSNKLEHAYKLSAQKLLKQEEFEEIGATFEHVSVEIPVELSRKTVIEYFTAKWLSKRYLNSKKIIDNLIERTSVVFLSSYLAAYKAEKKRKIPINEYAEYGLLRSLKAILELDSTNKPCLSRLIRKGKRKTYEVLKFLLEHYNDSGCREFIQYAKYVDSNLVKYVNQQVNGQTPLQTAAEHEKVDLACELMLKGADVSVLHPFSSFITSMATYATEQLTNGNTRLGPIVVVLLEKLPQTTANLDDKIQFPKLLSYLFSGGHVKLIEQLLKVRHSHERCELLETKIDGKSLLDRVNENESIEDENRLHLISYLVNNASTNFLNNNIDSILRSACNYGHEQTFNYFITHSKTSIDILHEALRSNDEKIVNFLMRNSKRTKDANGNNALHQAVSLGVSRKTMNCLLGKVGINDVNNAGETVLHLAFKEGASLSTIKFLVNAGASLTITDNSGFHPWIVAIKDESSRYCKEQQRELMSYLNAKNVRFPEGKSPNLAFDVTKKEILPKLAYFENADNYDVDYHNGESRLHAALPCRDQNNWCKFLINHGADVNIVMHGKSAFDLALEHGCYDVAELMLQHGAIIDKTDKTEMAPLDYLKYRANDSRGQSMKEILVLANKIFNSGNELLKAIQSLDLNKIDSCYLRFLLNCRDKHGRTLLHVAAYIENTYIIDQLHKFSKECQFHYKDFIPMDVNAVDNRGNTPLHLAAKKNKECVAKLLSIGARFRMTNLDGKKPMDMPYSSTSVRKLLQAAEDLFKLIEQQKIEDVRKLLKTYPEIQNARDHSGKTVLQLVKDEELTKFLLANKYVDVNALDDDRKPPIYYAARENYLNGVKLLLKAGASYDFKGFQNGNNESFKLLQKIDELFNDMHSHQPRFFVNGNHWALDKELGDIGNAFEIARDIIVNVKDSQKNSLLHYAAKYDYIDVTENLLKNGATPNSRNKYGKTPLDLAVNSKQLFKSVNNLFIKDVRTRTDEDPIIAVNCRMSGRFTLLHKATEAGNSETVKWPIDRGTDTKSLDK